MEMIAWRNGYVEILDQTRLPARGEMRPIRTVEDMAEAIEKLRVRGAPLIGVSAAYGMALSAQLNQGAPDYLDAIRADEARLRATRPTAVNLFWALDRAVSAIIRAYSTGDEKHAAASALEFAERMKAEDIATNRKLSENGQSLLVDGDGVLTHCNAGALATAGYGTALGVIRAAVDAGKHIHVYADETRPLLQGARLTCWELMRDGIPVTLEADGMAGALMQTGRVQKVVVGADRIAKNGDTANKIGTYSVAVLARHHGIPFYVAAPESTIDRSLASGELIPIEHRDGREMRSFQGVQSAPRGVDVFNPAFDVTPHALIAAIITEKSVYYPDAKGRFLL